MEQVRRLIVIRLVLNFIMVGCVVWIAGTYGFEIDLVVPLVTFSIASMLLGALSRF